MQNDLDLALEKIKNKNFPEAIKLYEKILNQEPENFDANLNLGSIYAQTKNLSKASEFLSKAIKINPKIPDVHNNLAMIEITLKNYDKAIEHAQNAIKLNPNFFLAFNNLGIAQKEKGNYEEAKSSFQKSISINSKGFLAYYNLGIVNYELNDAVNSEESYIKSIENNPKYISTYINLLNLYEKLNKTEKLEKLLYQAKKIFPGNDTLKLIEGKLNFKIKNYEKNYNLLQSLNFYNTNKNREILRLTILAKSLDQIGNYTDAFKYFKEANNLNYEINKNKVDKNRTLETIERRINFFKNSEKLKWNNKNQEISDNDPIFLVGFPRSGTTLLDTILRSHPKVNVIEEKPIISKFIENLNIKINSNLEKLNSLDEKSISDMRSFYFKIREKYIYENKEINIDKMPLNLIHMAEITKFFPNAKFIFAIRHPRDCVLSSFMQSFSLNDSMANFLTLEDSIIFYNKLMELCNIYTSSLEINFHIIKYESVVSNFNETINNLLQYLNLDWSDEIIKFHETAAKRGLISTPSYDQVNRPIYSESVGRWKNYEKEFLNIKISLDTWINKYNY